MNITPQRTPNPNALKFSVGIEVGGPRSYVRGNAEEEPVAERLLEISEIVSVFMTADFITVSKTADTDWSTIAPRVQAVLEEHYLPHS